MLWARDMVNGVRVNRLVVFVVSAGRRRKAAVAIGRELECVLSYLEEGGLSDCGVCVSLSMS